MNNEKDMELQNQEQETVDTEKTKDKEDPKYRGQVLMQRALTHLENGEMEEFETDRALANKFFDEMSSEDEEMDALYTESRNFGIIYNVFESNVPKLMESKIGKKSLKNIVKAIKSDKILHEQFKAYNNLQPLNGVKNVTEYINEAISLSPKFNKELVKESNEKLIRLFKKENIDEMIDIDDDKLNLYEAIEYVTMNKKNLNNIDEFINATNIIKESIEKLPISEDKNSTTIKDYANEVDAISESVGNELNSAEIKLIKEVSNGNGETYFNECKATTLAKINEMISKEKDMDSKSRLSQIYEKINRKEYNKKNAIVDIAEMIEMQNTIDE